MNAPMLEVLRSYAEQHGNPDDFVATIAAVADLIEASDELVANLLSITKRGIRTPISTRQAAINLQHAVARVGGAK